MLPMLLAIAGVACCEQIDADKADTPGAGEKTPPPHGTGHRHACYCNACGVASRKNLIDVTRRGVAE